MKMRVSEWPTTCAAVLMKCGYGTLLISIGPVLLLMFPALPFVNASSCDPLFVYGLYFNLPEFLQWRPGSRQVGRLTETLPGYLLGHFVPGIAFDYILFLLFFLPAVFFLYKSAALLFSRERAACAAIFFALSPILIGNYAVTFSGTGVTYEIMALYCAVRAMLGAGRRQIFGWMLLSGIAWGAAIEAHLSILIASGFIYLGFAIYAAVDFHRSVRSRIETIAIGATGALCGAAAIAVASGASAVLAWGAPFATIFNQVSYIPGVLKNNSSLYWHSGWYWQTSTTGLFLLGLVAAATAATAHGAYLTRGGASTDRRSGFAGAVAFLLVVLALIYDSVLHDVLFEYEYYYVFLWPFLALVIFAFPIDQAMAAKAGPVVLFAVVCLAGLTVKQSLLPEWAIEYRAQASLGAAIVASVLLLALWRSPRPPLLVAYLLVLASFTLFARPHQMGAELWNVQNSALQRHSYARLHVALDFLALVFADPAIARDQPLVWTDPDDTPDGDLISAAYLGCTYHRFPTVDAELWRTGRDFKPGSVLVVVARPPHTFRRKKSPGRAQPQVEGNCKQDDRRRKRSI